MPRTEQITYEDIEDITIILNLKQKVNDTEWVPAIMSVRMEAVASNGESETVSKNFELGARTETEPTNKQLYNLLNSAQAGPALAARLKEVAQTAIEEDITA